MEDDGAVTRSLLWLGKKRTSRVVLILGSVLLLAILMVLFSFLLAQDISAFGTFPEGATVCDVDVSGLTKAEATVKCEAELAEIADRPLTLEIDDEAYPITPEEIGLKLNIAAMVDEAYSRAWNVNIVERMARRFLKKPKAIGVSVTVEYNEELLGQFVQAAMRSIDRPPHDAYIDVSTGIGKIVPAVDGRKANYEQLLAEAKEALGTSDRTVDVQVERSPPTLTDEGFGRYILINLGSNTLSLYDRDTLLVSYSVATGSPEWPTPIGQWAIRRMEKNPTWHNRDAEWSKNMPDSIPPGPGNPLGTRAMYINAGGIIIHGTSSTWSLGRSVSHGCIRMSISEVEALFEQVGVGTPVFMITESGKPGFDCSKKAFWQ